MTHAIALASNDVIFRNTAHLSNLDAESRLDARPSVSADVARVK